LHAQGFNEGKGKPLTSEDFRFTTKKDTIYVMRMGRSDKQTVTVASLAKNAPNAKVITNVTILGYKGSVQFKQDHHGLVVEMPTDLIQDENATVLKIS